MTEEEKQACIDDAMAQWHALPDEFKAEQMRKIRAILRRHYERQASTTRRD